MKIVSSQKRSRRAIGTKRANGIRKISISFDDYMFDLISDHAEHDGVSFNAKCREFIRRGAPNEKPRP